MDKGRYMKEITTDKNTIGRLRYLSATGDETC
jgi:hypothetical protein